MTFLEVAGVVALSAAAAQVTARLTFKQERQIPLSVAEEQMGKAVSEAFQAGMLCAADIVTHSGNEQLAGDIRRTVEYVRSQAANDN